MKVLHLIDSGGFYGAEVMLLELVNEQRAQGVDAQVCSIGAPSIEEKALEKQLKLNGIPTYIERMIPGPNILGVLRLLKYAKNNNFDILHSHGYKANILLAIVPKWLREIPLITTLHGWTATKLLSKLYLYESVDRLMLKNMDYVVSVSEKNLEKKGVDPNKIKNFKVISNGISLKVPKLEEINLVAQKMTKLREQGYVIGSIGRLSFEKGYDVLLKAFSELIKDNKESYQLALFGDGLLKNELIILCKELNIESNVHFFGYQENAGQYISMMDVYVNSSRSEGVPITILEAMRACCPVVATDVGGVRKLLNEGEFGSLVKSDNIKQLKAEIFKVFTEDRSCKVEAAKKHFNNHYSSEIMTRKYIKLYEKVVL